MNFVMLRVILVFLTIAGCSESSKTSEDNVVESHALSVFVGPTTIPQGDATGASAITIRNEFFAVAFAVDTPSPGVSPPVACSI